MNRNYIHIILFANLPNDSKVISYNNNLYYGTNRTQLATNTQISNLQKQITSLNSSIDKKLHTLSRTSTYTNSISLSQESSSSGIPSRTTHQQLFTLPGYNFITAAAQFNSVNYTVTTSQMTSDKTVSGTFDGVWDRSNTALNSWSSSFSVGKNTSTSINVSVIDNEYICYIGWTNGQVYVPSANYITSPFKFSVELQVPRVSGTNVTVTVRYNINYTLYAVYYS